MVVRMRLARFGRTHSPFYRIVVADSRRARDGKHLEVVGTYNPIPNKRMEKDVRLNLDRCKYWLSVGAQPSDTVARLLGSGGVLPQTARRVPTPKTAVSEEEEA
eukprot:TRINITY_DN14944_c0_g1_i1.p2 TRINITY_DN14944_c0_g1~~TRINITY_DN14944_c0_g1_i1.p2  ORF type:complete len:104 (+),score=12.68 TRINITY_DN14944_c0_g1_i1:172-483(+)